jgi:hypothetical protein
MRVSAGEDKLGPADSAFIYIERNLYIVNGFLCLPIRSCLYIAGPGESILTNNASTSINGHINNNATAEMATSKKRFIFAVLPDIIGCDTSTSGSPIMFCVRTGAESF